MPGLVEPDTWKSSRGQKVEWRQADAKGLATEMFKEFPLSIVRMIEEDNVNLNWELVFNIGTAALALLLLFWLDGAGLKGL